MKSIIPVVMAGIIAIYGLVVAVLIANNIVANLALHKWVQSSSFIFSNICFIYNFYNLIFYSIWDMLTLISKAC